MSDDPVAIGYTRLSQESDRSIEDQKAEIREFCNEHDYRLKEIYDDGQRASGFDNTRPEYTRMITDLEDSDVDAVVVRNADRLSRDKNERLLFLTQYAADVTVYSTERGEEIEMESGTGFLMEAIQAYMDDVQKRKEIERARRVVQKRQENGYYQGKPPYGLRFDEDGKHLVPDDEEFENVTEVLRLRDEEGLSYREIAEETGVAKSTVGRIIRNQDRNQLPPHTNHPLPP